ncbi:MAG: hypothetical protein GX905_03870 [Bacteroidales bacterium]|nr:hypothetical protein [Bacteroidales bacterium]
MSNIFQAVESSKPRRTNFDLSFENKLTMNMGKLVPFMVKEVLPSDTFNIKSEVFVRFAPLLAPVMHRVNVFTHFFFVPNRLVWDNWETFITGGEDGLQEPVMPFIETSDLSPINGDAMDGTLCDYLGVPFLESREGIERINALPFRAYQLIYNEYYRDQNLIEKIEYGGHGDGWISDYTDLSQLIKLRTRAYEKDYFTSALPWTQKGAEVTLPITGDGKCYIGDPPYNPTLVHAITGSPTEDEELKIDSVSGSSGILRGSVSNQGMFIDPYANNNIMVDLSDVSSTSINDLREAFQLQVWLERNARGGSRYIEQLMSHFGVKSSDARLQRPEYLGGGMSPVVISEVMTQAASFATDDETVLNPVGAMAGKATSVQNSNGISAYFEEHGWLIGIISVMPRTTYYQGIPRQLSKMDKFDYYWPEFAHLGEQEVLNKEVYFTNELSNDPNGVFGYQSRYAEYKYYPNEVHGSFRNDLDHWHFGRRFTSEPNLNEQFIECDYEEIWQPFAVQPTENMGAIYCQIYNSIVAQRPMPYESTPGLVDHF